MVDVSPGGRDRIRRGRRRTLSMKCESRSNFSRTRVQNPIPKEDEVMPAGENASDISERSASIRGK